MTQRAINRARGQKAAKGMKAAGYEGATDWAASVTDALTDLRHFCDTQGLDFGALDSCAHDHYSAERHASDAEAQDSERHFKETGALI